MTTNQITNIFQYFWIIFTLIYIAHFEKLIFYPNVVSVYIYHSTLHNCINIVLPIDLIIFAWVIITTRFCKRINYCTFPSGQQHVYLISSEIKSLPSAFLYFMASKIFCGHSGKQQKLNFQNSTTELKLLQNAVWT